MEKFVLEILIITEHNPYFLGSRELYNLEKEYTRMCRVYGLPLLLPMISVYKPPLNRNKIQFQGSSRLKKGVGGFPFNKKYVELRLMCKELGIKCKNKKIDMSTKLSNVLDKFKRWRRFAYLQKIKNNKSPAAQLNVFANYK